MGHEMVMRSAVEKFSDLHYVSLHLGVRTKKGHGSCTTSGNGGLLASVNSRLDRSVLTSVVGSLALGMAAAATSKAGKGSSDK